MKPDTTPAQATPPPMPGKGLTVRVRWMADAITRQKRLASARTAGGNRHLLEQTRILRDVIEPKVLADEPGVAETRWAEYGYTNAFHATEGFTRIYVDCYQNWRRKYISQHPHRCPVDPEFAQNDPGTMNALYSARQFADALGIPYLRFITGMFERLMGPGLYRRIPLPSQLFPPKTPRTRKGRKLFVTKSGVPVAHKALRHGLKVREEQLPRCDVLAYDWDKRFFANNYAGDPAQERALRLLAVHPVPVFTPRQVLRDRLSKGRISVENARRVFPLSVVDSALQDVGALPEIAPPDQDLAPYRPHCLGLIQPEELAPACTGCKWSDKCRSLAEVAEQQQRDMTGYANRRERDRNAACERKRNERARKSTTLKLDAGTVE